MKKIFIILLIQILLPSSKIFAQNHLKIGMNIGHFNEENANGIGLMGTFEQSIDALLLINGLFFSVLSHTYEYQGLYKDIQNEDSYITLADYQRERGFLGYEVSDFKRSAYLIHKTLPNKFSSFSILAGVSRKRIISEKSEWNIQLGSGLSLIHVRRIAYNINPEVIRDGIGEYIGEKKVNFFIFQNQRYLDIPVKLSLEYFYKISPKIATGLQLSYQRFMFSGNSYLTLGGVIRV